LYGFHIRGEIMREQVLSKWSADVMSHYDLIFADTPFPTKGIFDPPCWNLIKDPLTPSISHEGRSSNMVPETGGLEFDPWPRIFYCT
jgi:hypothetical protein